jgi:hypothetical protein
MMLNHVVVLLFAFYKCIIQGHEGLQNSVHSNSREEVQTIIQEYNTNTIMCLPHKTLLAQGDQK